MRNSFSQEKKKEGFRVKSCRERFLACERVLRNPMMRLFARSRVIFTTRKGVGWNYRSINSKYVRSWNGWVTVPPCVSREKSCIMTTCNTCPRFNKILFTGRKEGRKNHLFFLENIFCEQDTYWITNITLRYESISVQDLSLKRRIYSIILLFFEFWEEASTLIKQTCEQDFHD